MASTFYIATEFPATPGLGPRDLHRADLVPPQRVPFPDGASEAGGTRHDKILPPGRINIPMNKILVYTIKKTGTHCISNIISLVLNAKNDILSRDELYGVVPHVKNNYKALKKNSGLPAFCSSHPCYIGYDEIAKLKNIGIIHSTRNPIDTLISRFYFFDKKNYSRV